MDKRRSILNVTVSILSRIVLLIAALFVRRLVIRYIGNDANGLNSLYSSIIGMLAVAELGVGSAIIFSMYKPIVEGEKNKVAALYGLYGRLYRIIGAVIFCAGLIVMPFLPKLINDFEGLNVNVYLTFFLSLVSVALSYLYGAKTSLIEAHKDNFITTGILTVAKLLRYGLQGFAVLIWRSFTVYLTCQIIETIVIWFLTEMIVRKKYGDIIVAHKKVDGETKKEIGRNVKAMFMHKIGTILVNGIDSVIISGFIGVIILGKYSNYTLIAGMVMSIMTLFFSPLTSVVGHLCADGDQEKTKRYYDYFYCLNYVLGVVFFLGYYAIIDNVVALLFGSDLIVSRAISFIITLNQFTQYMRRATLLFRDASGAFYYDRWKPIAEGLSNLILSLIFVQVFPEELRIVGVVVATIITTLLICDIVDPYVVFKHVFGKSPKKYYFKNYGYIGVFIITLMIMSFLIRDNYGPVKGLLVNGIISVGLSLTTLVLVASIDKSFRFEIQTMGCKIISWANNWNRRKLS